MSGGSPHRRDCPKGVILPALLLNAMLIAVLLPGCVSTNPEEPESSVTNNQARMASFNYGLAAQFWERDHKDLAMRYLQKAVRHYPEGTASRLKILDLYLIEHNPEGVLAYLEECPGEMRITPPFLKRRALALDMMGKGDEAGRLLEKAEAKVTDDPQCLEVSTDNLVLRGKAEQAVGRLKERRVGHPDETGVLETLAELSRALGKFNDEAQFRLELARRTDGGGDSLRKAASAFARAGRGKEGLERLLVLGPEIHRDQQCDMDAALGYLHYAAGEYKSAVFCFEKAFSSVGITPDLEESLAWAEALMRRGLHEKAAGILKEQLNKDPEHNLVRAALAWAYIRSGSEEMSRKIMAEAPEYGEEGDLLQAVRKRLEEGHEN